MNQQEPAQEEVQDNYDHDRLLNQQNLVNNNVNMNQTTINVQAEEFIPRIKSKLRFILFRSRFTF